MKMANAIKAVRIKEMGLKWASKVFQVPRSTLKDKVNSKETKYSENDQYLTWSETSIAP
jgi:hypothetical protein